MHTHKVYGIHKYYIKPTEFHKSLNLRAILPFKPPKCLLKESHWFSPVAQGSLDHHGRVALLHDPVSSAMGESEWIKRFFLIPIERWTSQKIQVRTRPCTLQFLVFFHQSHQKLEGPGFCVALGGCHSEVSLLILAGENDCKSVRTLETYWLQMMVF